MFFPRTNFTVIALILVSILRGNFGELIVLRHPPGGDDYNTKLTCQAEDDDSALIWNYNPDEHEVNSGRNYFPAFKPEKASSKNITGCAVWESKICIAGWNGSNGWNAVSSTTEPTAPVFDHRWEGFKEFAFEKVIEEQEYLYVNEVGKSSETVVFSVRGSSHIYVFLCKTEQLIKGPCIWIMLSGWHGTRSEIRSCADGAPDPNQTSLRGNCIDLAKSQYESSKYLDAYEWRTFILKWNSAERSIKVFTDDDREPFLSATNSTWENVPHIFVRGERPSRVRFHFYEYFLTNNTNAVISTTEFIINDVNFCVEVLVGVCPECQLNVTLIHGESRDIPIASIFGGESLYDKLMSWRPVRLNATLPNLNSSLVKLEMVPILMKNEVEGLWAIDKFRKCKSVVGLRKSSITIDREMMASTNPVWPTAKCQKLSYTEKIVVDSIYSNPYRDGSGLVLKRKSRAENTEPPCSNVKLEIYESGLRDDSISLRLKPLHPTQYGIEQYVVSTKSGRRSTKTQIYNVSQRLECSRWEESVCLENFLVDRLIRYFPHFDVPPFDIPPAIVVAGQKDGHKVICSWEIEISTQRSARYAEEPTNPTWDYEGDGIGTLKWGYPSLPRWKIKRFDISITRNTSKLLLSPTGSPTIQDSIDITEPTKEYTKTLHLLPSTDYTIDIRSIDSFNYDSNPATVDVKMPSGVNFDTKSELEVTNNGTRIKLKIPAVVNATDATYIEVSMKGTWKCKAANNLTERIVRKYQVELSQDKNYMFDANETTTSSDMIDCFLDHGKKYQIIVKVVEEHSNSTITLPSRFITFPSISDETMPQVRGPCSNVQLEMYEADLETNSISLRLKPLHPTQYGIERYVVSIKDLAPPSRIQTYNVSQGLECRLWEESVCLENFRLPKESISPDPPFAIFRTIVVAGQKDGQKVSCSWEAKDSPVISGPEANKPTNPKWDYEGDGVGTFKVGYPSLPKTKVNRFWILFGRGTSRLLQPNDRLIVEDILVTEVKKEYTRKLRLQFSTDYHIFMRTVNQRSSESSPVTFDISMPSGVRFDTNSELEVTNNGTRIQLKIPAVVYATDFTYIKVSMKGTWKCETSNNMTERIVRKYKVELSRVENYTFDANETTTSSDMIDCFLDHGKKYEIIVKVVEEHSNSTITLPSRFITFSSIDDETMPQVRGPNLIWLIIFPTMAIFLIPLCILYRKRKLVAMQPRQPSYVEPMSVSLGRTGRNNSPTHLNIRVLNPSIPRRPSYLEIIPSSPTTTPINDWTALDATTSSPQREAAEDRSSDHVYTLPNAPDFYCVSMENFAEYAKNAATSRRLHSQFVILDRILPSSLCEYGELPENVPKNRKEASIAYDNSRVVLEKIPGDPHSDYINASYIKGYQKDRAYIAAQGPMPNTVNDFWRMVWQEKVRVICMLTNVMEGGETKCEKYWPDVGTRVKYGVFDVSNTDDQVFADYTFRTFELSYERHTRKVTHLHYTGWPNLGVPKYPQSLVEYLRKLELTPDGNGPVVVHCSTGDDRTGTIILCEICLRQAVAEKAINVMAVTARMRESRANMVGTLQQYVLAHIIIAESLTSWPTQIPCRDILSNRINKLRIQLPFDMKRLRDTTWQLQALQSSAADSPPTAEHSTNDEISGLVQDGSDIIYDDVLQRERNQNNAISVDGVTVKNQYLACCLPSPLNLPNFWEFAVEKDIKLIIILQCSDPRDPTCCDIMIDESITVPSLKIEVENQTGHDKGEYFTIEKLRLTETSKANARSRSLTVLTCREWGCGTIQKPPPPQALISLWQASEKIPRKAGQSLVLCHDGVTGCGLYLAMSFLLERMAVERECDVISAVRAVRRSNPKFVQLMEQCEYLYDVAQAYAEYFQCYANFS